MTEPPGEYFVKVKMMARTFCLLAVSLFLFACDDIDRIVWSNDGGNAAVICADGLRLTDQTGSLSKVLALRVKLVDWIYNPKRLIVVSADPVKKWSEIEKLETAEDLATIKTSCAEILLRADLSKGDWKKFTDSAADLPFLMEAVILADNTDHKRLSTLFGREWNKAIAEVSLDLYSLRLKPFSDGTISDGKVLFKSTREIVAVCPQFSDKAIAVVLKPEPFQQGYPFKLVVIDGEAGKIVHEIDGVNKFPAWSSDGNSLVYIGMEGTKPPGDSLTHMGSLRSERIFDKKGVVSAKKGEQQVLARVLFGNESRVRVRKNGDIVFSSHDLTLPCVPDDVSHEHAIYTISPGQRPTVAHLIPKGALRGAGNLHRFFEFNPSETVVCLPDKEGFVSLVDLASGELTMIDTDELAPSNGLKFLPHFLSDDLLCLPGRLADSQENKVLLYSLKDKQVRALSGDWPESATRKFLD